MTDDYEDWDAPEQLAWEPKTPKEEREALGYAPLATLRATPATAQAAALMCDLAERYPGHKRQRARPMREPRRWSVMRTRAVPSSPICSSLLRIRRSEGWLRCSHKKTEYTGKYVRWATFDGIRTAWLEAGLIEHKLGYPGMLAFASPGPMAGKLTRYRATPTLLE